MSKVWKGLLLLSVLLMSISSVAAHDSQIEIESNAGFSSVEQSGVSDNASVRVIPDNGLAGSTHTILISGLNDGEAITVSILYDGEEVYSTEQTADNRGRVEIDIYTELSDPMGEYSVEVLNANNELIGQDTLTISEPPGLNATLNINPTEAEVGTVFSLEISDARPFVDLQVLFRNADGAVVYSTSVRATVDGLARVEFPTEEIIPGTYSVSVVLDSDHTQEVASGTVTVLEQHITTTVEPTQIRLKQDVSIKIDSLDANTTATVEILSSDGEVIYSEELTTDDAGTASLVYTAPEELTLGEYSIHVLQDGQLVSTSSFIIFLPEFAVSVSPDNGTPNTNFLVQIVGLHEDETVRVELVNTSGEVLQSIDVTADADGNARALMGQRLRLELGMYAIRVMRNDIVAFGQPIQITEKFVSPESPVETDNVTVSVDPESGAIPTNYTFHIEGLPPDSDLSIGILFDGEEVYSTNGTSDENGVYEIVINTEPSDSEGRYTFEVRMDGDVVGSVDFIAGETPPATDENAQTDENKQTDADTSDTVSISLNPSAALPGDRVEILVNKLEAGETVTIEMRYGQEVVYSTEQTATDSGTIAIAVGIEDTDPTGIYGVVVLRGDEVIANAALNVAQDESDLPEAPPEISVTPSSGPIGTDHTIEITGLKAEEALEINLEFEGETVLSLERSADKDGKLVVVLSSELGDTPGDYAIQVVRDDGTEISSTLTIEDSILMGEAKITVEPASGSLETDHRITVTGLLPNESVTLNIEYAGEVVYSTERSADDSGMFFIDITSQEGDEFGEYDVIVRRENGDESQGTFIVEGDASPIEITVEPDSGPIDTDYVFTITGLKANTSYEFAVEYDGTIVYSSTVDSNADGEATITLTSQEGDEIGQYRLTLLGDNVELASAEFEVTGIDVTGDSFSDVQISIDPDSGTRTTVHETTITGLMPDETVSLEIVYDGETVYQTELTADADGVATISIASEADDPLGEYQILVLRDGAVIGSESLFVTAEGTAANQDSPATEINGVAYNGRINANSGETAFTFSGDAGQDMLISLTSNEFDTYLILQDDNGQELAVNDNNGASSNSQIAYSLPYSGEYRLVVSSANYQNEHETVFGNFELLVEPFNSVASNYAETVAVTFDENTISQFIQFEGQAGDVISIAVDSGATIDTALSVLDPSNMLVASDDDSGPGYDPEINHLVLAESGTYTVIVRSFVPGERGEANVSINLDGSQTLGSEARSIELSSKQNNDLLVFDAQAGETVTLTVALESGNTASLNISAEQYGIPLMNYQTVALPEQVTLSFIVPDDGVVTIHVSDTAVHYAVLLFSLGRD